MGIILTENSLPEAFENAEKEPEPENDFEDNSSFEMSKARELRRLLHDAIRVASAVDPAKDKQNKEV